MNYEDFKKAVVDACKKRYENHESGCWLYGLMMSFAGDLRPMYAIYTTDIKPLLSEEMLSCGLYEEMCYGVFEKLIRLTLSIVDLDFTGKTPLELCQITCKSMFGD
jgi:hypothetical protein